jgi:hypothetical protein|tara:strand:- start:208 stop:483 length:276 start_codon:yes stop_codon:yes gene_type:complete
METTLIEGLAQYGPLGLWTASLLFMNWQQRKDRIIEEKRAQEALQFHQEKIATALLNQTHLIQTTMDKVEGGLAMVREKYAEDRMLRLKDK